MKYIYKKLKEESNKLKKELVEYLKRKDNEIAKNRSKDWKIHSFKKRVLFINDGNIEQVSFKRRLYKNMKTKEWAFLLDRKMGIVNNKFVQEKDRQIVFDSLTQYKSYKEIVKNKYFGLISESLISKILKDKNKKEEFKKYNCKNSFLTINIDGFWINQNKSKKKIEIKSFCFFTGRIKKNNKNKLISRNIYFSINQKNLEILANKIKEIIKNNYVNFKTIRIIGDGGLWIKKISNILNMPFYIDKFHYHQALQQVFGRYKYNKWLNIIENKKIPLEEIKRKLLYATCNQETGEITNSNFKMARMNFICNYRDFYLKTVKDKMFSVIESIQSHYLGSYFKNRRKGYSKETIEIFLNRIMLKTNLGI